MMKGSGRMKLKEYHIAYLPFVALSLLFIALSLSLKDLDSKLLPLLFAGVMLIASFIGLWQENSAEKQKTAAGEDSTGAEQEKTNWFHYIRDGAWLVGFVLVIYFAGFLVAMPVYTLAYTRLNGTKWWVAITLAVIVTLSIYLSFERAVGLNLYRGMFFGA
jgi:hypothetical protein